MPGSPVKTSGTCIQSGIAIHSHPDAEITSLATEIAQRCSELSPLDERMARGAGPEQHSVSGAEMVDAQATEIAADRLEERIAKCRAVTVEGLKAKATIADILCRFGYESISDSIIRDLITSDGPLPQAGELNAT